MQLNFCYLWQLNNISYCTLYFEAFSIYFWFISSGSSTDADSDAFNRQSCYMEMNQSGIFSAQFAFTLFLGSQVMQQENSEFIINISLSFSF